MIEHKKALDKGLIKNLCCGLYYINKLKTLLSATASISMFLVSIIFSRGLKHA
jgi:hypothetical protein|tara:strand:- start:5310 stop:5468 length:159 start_codon:yes stop_codon:yes gene_type:complete